MRPRERPDARIPIAFVALVIVHSVIALVHPSRVLRSDGHSAALFSMAFMLVLTVPLLRRSRVAWWIFVVVYVGAFATGIQQVSSDGFSAAWALRGVIVLVSSALLMSAPMRRFVRLGQ